MNFIRKIFLKLAERLGLSLQPKPVSVDDYSDTVNVSLTATVSNSVATLTLQDSDITIEGDSARARYMQDFLDYYTGDLLDVAAEVALGTGDCIVKPYTDGKRLGVDIIKNSDFVVCESIGNDILACIMKVGEFKDEYNTLYERFETQMVRQDETESGQTVDTPIILNTAYRNGKEIALTEVPAWSGISPEEKIPNVSKPLFGRYKCPTVNRQDVNGTNGVKITHGLDSVMEQAVEAYNRFNREYASGEKMVFVDKTLMDRDEKGNLRYPDEKKKHMFMLVKGVGGKESLIQEHTPDIRSADLEKGIEVNFKMLEMLAGLSPGILTTPVTQQATATEIRDARTKTFAFITKFRRRLEKGTNDLLDAVEAIANRNNLSPIGPWHAQYDWSTAYIEQINERFHQLVIAHGLGAVDTAEVRAYEMDEGYEEAKARVEQIAEESAADLLEEAGMNEGGNQNENQRFGD